MSETVLVEHLGRRIALGGEPPKHYTAQGRSAWIRGFGARCRGDEFSGNPYVKRFSRRAWMAGYDAASVAICAALETTVDA
jgi:hypothetical protein